MKERYEGIDGLKAYAILGIALMHILANGKYEASGFVFDQLIPSFTNLVFLFMMVSGFGMCCGYYQKFKEQKIGVGEFYTKRYSKIWPYFALLCVVDFVISPSKSALYEVFANLTLCQGLLPNMNISVIGVSWTLAVIFVFYLLFPFFCFLLENKKRGKKNYIIINAEGVGDSINMAKRIEDATGIETRATILGHMQRGGSPTCKDRVYASTMGAMAVDLLCQGKTNRVVGYKNGQFIDFDIEEALAMKKTIPAYQYDVAKTLAL